VKCISNSVFVRFNNSVVSNNTFSRVSFTVVFVFVRVDPHPHTHTHTSMICIQSEVKCVFVFVMFVRVSSFLGKHEGKHFIQDIHPLSRSNRTLFCRGIQFVPRDLLHIPTSRKIFNVRMKVIFGEKSLSSLLRILRQDFETRVNHCVPCDIDAILFNNSKRCGKLMTCSPLASSWVWKM